MAILDGHEVKDRISAFSLINPSLTGTQAEIGWRALSDHLASHEDRDQDEGPLPPSIEELTVRFLGAVIMGLLGFLAVAELAKVATSWWTWVPAVLLVAAIAQPMKRIARLRTTLIGWQAGVVGTLLLAVIAASQQLIR